MKNKPERCHFIGVGGVGMSALARLLIKQGVCVSGSDISSSYITDKLIKEGVDVQIGHSAGNIAEGMTVIYTTGVDANNPEIEAARKLGCSMLHRSDLLRLMMEGYQALSVAGTHGKTTTSSLLASVLHYAGADPTFAIGGTLVEFQSNAHKGLGPYFVAEACESDGTFVKYPSYGAIITNIDSDHLDFFGSMSVLIDAFKTFVSKVSHPDLIFWCGDDQNLRSIEPPGVSYGYDERSDLRVFNEKQVGWKCVFDIAFHGKVYQGIELSLIGRHNALNAAAVFGLCLSLGIAEKTIREGMAGFQGVLRRCEKKGEVRDVLVVDDYAHHPTEIATTLQGIRKAVGERRLVVVFQPHRYTRTKACLSDFANALEAADVVVVTDIYAAGEQPIDGVNAQLVAETIEKDTLAKVHYATRGVLDEHVADFVRPHDVVVTLGAGDVTKLGNSLLLRWKVTPPKKWRVGVVFGGRSMEHEVSLKSARYVIESLNPELYEIALFGIRKNGDWVVCPVSLDEIARTGVQESSVPEGVLRELLRCDLFFPMLHGPYGEDGTLQGFFDTLGKAYVGCDHRSAALCMDKALTKKIASLSGVPVVPFLSFSQYEWSEMRDALSVRILNELRYPVFVKPLHLGSTVGVTKVEAPDDLENAIKEAFKVDTHLLVENGLKVREIEFAVMGNDTATTFPPGEILVDGRVYDYHGKYDEKDPIRATPQASLPEAVIELGMAWAKRVYLAAECKGLARVDFFLDDEGQLWLNEVNPIPGFTKHSLYPQICAANGLTGPKLVDKLIILALQRKRQLQRSLENL